MSVYYMSIPAWAPYEHRTFAFSRIFMSDSVVLHLRVKGSGYRCETKIYRSSHLFSLCACIINIVYCTDVCKFKLSR